MINAAVNHRIQKFLMRVSHGSRAPSSILLPLYRAKIHRSRVRCPNIHRPRICRPRICRLITYSPRMHRPRIHRMRIHRPRVHRPRVFRQGIHFNHIFRKDIAISFHEDTHSQKTCVLPWVCQKARTPFAKGNV